MLLRLTADDYALDVDPALGGSIARFEWRGLALMRATCGPSVLDTACFPLVPFSNRIAHGRFRAGGRAFRLAPNFPGRDHPHTLHGFGWLSPWRVAEADEARAVLVHEHEAGEWPWSYRAEQEFALSEAGLRHSLAVTNLSATPMFAGLGVHPYFPRSARTLYRGLHRGEYQVDGEVLPVGLDLRAEAIDWWQGAPVATRPIDTAYTGREGALAIVWPERNLSLAIEPSPALTFTVVYVPRDEDIFCVEPVSHAIDAINDADPQSGALWLGPRETMRIHIDYRAEALEDHK